ncbi:hypothetical protein Pcinc_021240 [Petrolisthes cinctipes]|uniref:Secreted protein n=1 Tax=Petrolisthes cinctipes TaxID=88211 RepID=A0AAE1KIP3_PETCI|nr:hypothetical protein Pcinc_021240 [Petrolisthes cinctipes]
MGNVLVLAVVVVAAVRDVNMIHYSQTKTARIPPVVPARGGRLTWTAAPSHWMRTPWDTLISTVSSARLGEDRTACPPSPPSPPPSATPPPSPPPTRPN